MPVEFGEPLSEREREIVVLVAEGLANKEIGARLFLSPNTVKVHLRNIFVKTGAVSRTELTMIAVREGWIRVAVEGGQEPASLTEAADAETGAADAGPWPAPPAVEPVGDAAVVSAEPVLSPWPWYRWVALLVGVVLAVGILLFPSQREGYNVAALTGGTLVDQPGNSGLAGAVELPGKWQELAALPVRRSRLGVAWWGGRLYAMGGLTAEGPTERLDIYEAATDSWLTGAPRPVALANIGAVSLAEGLLVPGGCDAQGQPYATVHLYRPAQNAWIEVAPLPVPLCGYALTAWQGQAYLFGGWDGQTYQALAYRYDPAANRWEALAPPQVARQFGAAAALGNRIFYVGGYSSRGELDTCEWYAPSENRWERCASLLVPRGGLGLAALGGSLYAIGGGWTTYLGFNERYLPSADQWTVLETPLVGEWRNLGLTASETSLYAVGGWSEDYLNRVYALEVMPYRVFIPVTLP